MSKASSSNRPSENKAFEKSSHFKTGPSRGELSRAVAEMASRLSIKAGPELKRPLREDDELDENSQRALSREPEKAFDLASEPSDSGALTIETSDVATTPSDPIVLAQATGTQGAVGGAGAASAATVSTSVTSGSVPALVPLLGVAAGGLLLKNRIDSSGSTAPSPAPSPANAVSVSGKVIDGYLAGATVFVDKDQDGVLDADEAKATTQADGSFTLMTDVAGPIVAFGGIDIDTKLPFDGVLKAPAGATVVTPLTTLMAASMEADKSLSSKAAQDKVLAAVGLSNLVGQSNLDLLKLDPVKAATAGEAGVIGASDALKVHTAGVAVASLMVKLAESVRESSGASADKKVDIANGVVGELTSKLSAGALASDKISDTAASVLDGIAAAARSNPAKSIGGVTVKADALAARRTDVVEDLAGLGSKLAEVKSLADVTAGQKEALGSSVFTLQLLHFADAESAMLASQTAPRLAAMVDRFEDEYTNSITLAGGDNFIPGPFLAGGTDSSVIAALNKATGSSLPASATVPIAAVDIALHNQIGVQASTIGNHEFDLGSRVLSDAVKATSTYKGAQFPHLSANLDFSGDSDLKSLYVDTVSAKGLETAASLNGKIVPSAIIVENGARIGLVGATTQLIESLSSPSGTEVKGFPTGLGANGEVDDMNLLAQQLQPVIDDLLSQGVNKIILMAHLQQIVNEKSLATKLSGVDIILAAGSNTRLGDTNDQAVAFAGHDASFADTYPLVATDKSGGKTLIVNTDNEFTYLGRLVVDFDVEGRILMDSVTKNAAINGAYAATDANVAKAWGVQTNQLASTAYAEGTRAGSVKSLTTAVQEVITSKDGNVYGYSNVYMEGERIAVRNQETNLGSLSADANGYALEQALGAEAVQTFIVSIKNGGGIRAQIGAISAPKSDGKVDKLPPEGGVSQLDVENSLRFDNKLMAFDTTPGGIKAILEHGVAALGSQGRFPQLGGVSFSYDPDLPAGSRVRDIALVDGDVRVNLYQDGVALSGVPSKISIVTLNFLANGGDSYPMKAHGENFRYLMAQGNGTVALSDPVPETLDYTATATIATYVTGGKTLLGEQKAFETYMKAFHATPQQAYSVAETPASLDTRIQNLNERSEDVLNPTASTVLLNASIDGLGDVVTLYFDSALDAVNQPVASQFTVLQGAAEQTVQGVEVSGNQVRLKLAQTLATTGSVKVSYRDVSPANDSKTLQSSSGADASDFRGVEVQNRLSLQGSGSELFAQASNLTLAGAEISAFDPISDRLFVTSSKGLQVLKVNTDLSMTLEGTVSLGSNDINSVAVKNGVVAVAVAAADKTQPGSVYFLNATANLSVTAGVIAASGFVEGEVKVGALPDMLVFTSDGTKVLVANEGERNTPADVTGGKSAIDPEGSVSIIDLSAVLASDAPEGTLPTVKTATFEAFNAQRDALKAKGVRLFAGEAGFETLTVAQDLEPEYIALSPDGSKAFVTLQENNAIGILDVAIGQFTDIVPLGLKSFMGHPFDGSDRDGPAVGQSSYSTSTNLQTDQPVFGMYMPDAIASFIGADGKSYYLIANEGDDRDDFLNPDETIRVSSSSYNLDDGRFPDETALKGNAEIGRLTVSNAPGNRGDLDGDVDIDRIVAYGARSFSILDARGAIVFDSGSHIEQFFAAGGVFNTSSPAGGGLFDDARSDNKGPEPEGITVGRVGDKTLAFVGLERGGGGVMIYDVTNPAKTSFVQHVRNPSDVAPEGVSFVAAKDSPSGHDVLFVANEGRTQDGTTPAVSASVTAFRRMPPALSKIGTYSTGEYDKSAAEIVAYDPATLRLFLVNALAAEVQVLSIADPASPTLIGKIDLSGYGTQVNSVAVQGGRVAAAVAAADATAAGKVVVFSADVAVSTTAAAPAGVVAFAAGVGPDMLTFTPDGKKILVANEAEAGSALTVANGGITVITLGADSATALSGATVQQLDFTAYNGKEGWLRERGVRILAGASASNDLEPEYIAVSPDGTRAWVTLQENSAFAVLDLSKSPATMIDIVPMGLKDHARGDLVMAAYDELKGSELASIGTDAFGKSVPTGGFSGLQYLGKDGSGNLRFLTVSDRGPNGEPINVDNDPALERPFLLPDYQARVSEVQFNPTTGKMSVVSTTLLTKPDGSKLTGLPNIPGTDEEPIQIVPADAAQKTGTFTDRGVTYGYKTLSYDPLGADLEGVYRLTDGTMWMVDEYRPAVYEFDATGKMLSRYVPAGTAALTAETGDSYGTETLPAHLIKRQANRGFEALAVDETGGYLYAFVQSPLDAVSGTVDTVGPLVRIVKMAIRDMTIDGAAVSKGSVVGEYAYLLERPTLRLGQLDKIGDAVFNAEAGTIFVFERDSDVGLESKKVLYEVDLRGATNLKTASISLPSGKTALEELSVDEMLAAGTNPVYKGLVANLSSTGYTPNDKAEGLALLPKGVLSTDLGLALINDNDFGVNGSGTETIGLGLLRFNGANDIDAAVDNVVSIISAPLHGAYMPDAIAAFKAGSKTYYITANEGDSRDVDVVKVSAAATLVDASAQAALAMLHKDLELVKDAGDIDGDGDIDRLVAFGGRSFSIFDSLGNRIYDSGDVLERLTAELLPNHFNASNAASSSGNKLDNRSDNKGPEPEAVTTTEIDGKVYAFIGLERVGGVVVVEVTDPYHPQLLSYTNSRDFSKTQLAAGDLGPEGIIAIPASVSPNGKPLVIVANEVSGTIGLYEFGPMSPSETDPTLWLNTAFSTSLAPSQGVLPV